MTTDLTGKNEQQQPETASRKPRRRRKTPDIETGRLFCCACGDAIADLAIGSLCPKCRPVPEPQTGRAHGSPPEPKAATRTPKRGEEGKPCDQ